MKVVLRMDIGEFTFERHDKGYSMVLCDTYDTCRAIERHAIGWNYGKDVEINCYGTVAVLFEIPHEEFHEWAWFHVPKNLFENELRHRVIFDGLSLELI